MQVTEKEAKTKWCPMGRGAHSKHNAAYNRWMIHVKGVEWTTKPMTFCLASECMWWEWTPAPTFTPEGIIRPATPTEEERSKCLGYCGYRADFSRPS